MIEKEFKLSAEIVARDCFGDKEKLIWWQGRLDAWKWCMEQLEKENDQMLYKGKLKGDYYDLENEVYFSEGSWVEGYLIGDDMIVGNVIEYTSDYIVLEYWYKVDPDSVQISNNQKIIKIQK